MNILRRQRQMEVTYWKAFAIGHGRADSKWAPGVCSRGAVFWREIQILLMNWMQTMSEREKWKVNPRFSWPEQPRGWVCLQLWCGRRNGEWEWRQAGLYVQDQTPKWTHEWQFIRFWCSRKTCPVWVIIWCKAWPPRTSAGGRVILQFCGPNDFLILSCCCSATLWSPMIILWTKNPHAFV